MLIPDTVLPVSSRATARSASRGQSRPDVRRASVPIRSEHFQEPRVRVVDVPEHFEPLRDLATAERNRLGAGHVLRRPRHECNRAIRSMLGDELTDTCEQLEALLEIEPAQASVDDARS